MLTLYIENTDTQKYDYVAIGNALNNAFGTEPISNAESAGIILQASDAETMQVIINELQHHNLI